MITKTMHDIDGTAYLTSELETINGFKLLFKKPMYSVGKVTIICQKYSGSECTVVIPEGVTHIEDSAFINNKTLKEIIFPKSLVSIGPNAFAGCTALERAELPQGLVRIDCNAFLDCTSIVRMVLPDSLVTLGDSAFAFCTSLRQTVLSNGLTTLPSLCFASDRALHEIQWPDRRIDTEKDTFIDAFDPFVWEFFDYSNGTSIRRRGTKEDLPNDILFSLMKGCGEYEKNAIITALSEVCSYSIQDIEMREILKTILSECSLLEYALTNSSLSMMIIFINTFPSFLASLAKGMASLNIKADIKEMMRIAAAHTIKDSCINGRYLAVCEYSLTKDMQCYYCLTENYLTEEIFDFMDAMIEKDNALESFTDKALVLSIMNSICNYYPDPADEAMLSLLRIKYQPDRYCPDIYYHGAPYSKTKDTFWTVQHKIEGILRSLHYNPDFKQSSIEPNISFEEQLMAWSRIISDANLTIIYYSLDYYFQNPCTKSIIEEYILETLPLEEEFTTENFSGEIIILPSAQADKIYDILYKYGCSEDLQAWYCGRKKVFLRFV